MSLPQRYPFVTRIQQHLYKLVKTAIGKIVIGLSLHKVLFRKVALIIVFHRVNDKASGDRMTCQPDEFRKYCVFFKRHFKVVSLSAFVEKMNRCEPFDRELIITFDDGYADNYECAAPILKELDLPATFFITTQFIDSDVVPWWDKEAPAAHKWMTWDQVRSLHSDGFDIGSHTCSHVDLAEVPADIAFSEIADSKKDLEAKLAKSIHLFAYPYGSREHISEETIAVIKKSGYRCCRGYGAINTAENDVYHLCGIPWSPWYTSPYHVVGDMIRRVLVKSKRF